MKYFLLHFDGDSRCAPAIWITEALLELDPGARTVLTQFSFNHGWRMAQAMQTAFKRGSDEQAAGVGTRFRMKMDTVKLIYKPVARRVTHQVLVDKNRSQSQPGRFGHLEVERIFSGVWHIYCELMPNEPHLAVHGSRMNMRMTCLSIAFFEVFSAAGIERSWAVELIAEISWKVYNKWRLFSGTTRQQRIGPAPPNNSESRVSLPVPERSPGEYRQVSAQEWDAIPRRLRPAR